jgi:hypothetical protein
MAAPASALKSQPITRLLPTKETEKSGARAALQGGIAVAGLESVMALCVRQGNRDCAHNDGVFHIERTFSWIACNDSLTIACPTYRLSEIAAKLRGKFWFFDRKRPASDFHPPALRILFPEVAP